MESPVVWNLESAVKAFIDKPFKDGDLISHDWMAWALDLPTAADREAQFTIMERVEQFKNALLVGHSVYIVSVRGQGYRVVPPSDQCVVATTQAMREIQRQFRKCQKALKHTRMDELSAEEAKRHTDTGIKIAALSGMVRRGRRDVLAACEAKP